MPLTAGAGELPKTQALAGRQRVGMPCGTVDRVCNRTLLESELGGSGIGLAHTGAISPQGHPAPRCAGVENGWNPNAVPNEPLLAHAHPSPISFTVPASFKFRSGSARSLLSCPSARSRPARFRRGPKVHCGCGHREIVLVQHNLPTNI